MKARFWPNLSEIIRDLTDPEKSHCYHFETAI